MNPPEEHRPGRVSRLKSQAAMALVIGAIALSAAIVGAVQYWTDGVVSIRPGHEGVAGHDALVQLFFLAAAGVLFVGWGSFLRHRARRAARDRGNP